jgi:hypothetical protein
MSKIVFRSNPTDQGLTVLVNGRVWAYVHYSGRPSQPPKYEKDDLYTLIRSWPVAVGPMKLAELREWVKTEINSQVAEKVE